jgi:hypothetical protein
MNWTGGTLIPFVLRLTRSSWVHTSNMPLAKQARFTVTRQFGKLKVQHVNREMLREHRAWLLACNDKHGVPGTTQCLIHSFIYDLYNGAVSCSDDMASKCWMINEWQIGKDERGSGRDYMRLYYGLEGLKNITKNLSQQSRYPNRDSKQALPKHKSEASPPGPVSLVLRPTSQTPRPISYSNS